MRRVVLAALVLCVAGLVFGQTQHGLNLTWTASVTPGVQGYNVYRATVTGGPYTKVNTTLVTGTNYLDTLGTPNTPYFYVVTASLNGIESVYSNEATATFPLVPADATGLKVVPQ